MAAPEKPLKCLGSAVTFPRMNLPGASLGGSPALIGGIASVYLAGTVTAICWCCLHRQWEGGPEFSSGEAMTQRLKNISAQEVFCG